MAGLLERIEAERLVHSALRGRGELAVRKVIRIADHAATFAAHWNRHPVVIEHDRRANGSAATMARAAELTRLAAHMSGGTLRAPSVIASFPDAGILIVEMVSGERLDRSLAKAMPAERNRLLAQSAEWIAHYGHGRRRQGAFGPQHWVQRMEETFPAALYGLDRALLKALLAHLATSSDKAAGSPVIQSAVHGNWSPLSAYHDGRTLWGVDIAGERWMALARACAGFLVTNQIYGEGVRPPDHFGLDWHDVRAFASAGILPEQEMETTLPFFIGERLFDELVGIGQKPNRAGRVRDCVAQYLAAPRLRAGGS